MGNIIERQTQKLAKFNASHDIKIEQLINLARKKANDVYEEIEGNAKCEWALRHLDELHTVIDVIEDSIPKIHFYDVDGLISSLRNKIN